MFLNKLKQNYYFTRILPFLLLFLFFAGTKPEIGDDDIYTKINKNMDIFGKLYKEIALNYVDEVDPDKFMKAGIEGMLGTLDPYTTFLDETRKDEVDLLTSGKYGGVGVTIGIKDSFIVITSLMEGYSAQREGLHVGDKILEIDGNNLVGKRIDEVRGFVRGAIGSQLKIKIRRSDKDLDFVLTRQEIKLKDVTSRGLIGGNIGYIKLERFNRNAENEMLDAIRELKGKTELKGMILDLRDNPGGLLDAALSILNKFVDRGSLLLTTRGRKQDSEKKYFSTEEPIINKNIPLILIVNENSASASEILAGAIQDLDRGVIVGTKSFGKGLVQIFTQLSFDTQLRITNQKYFTPSGRWIQAKNYFKENKFGVFKPNPYYNQIEFKTLNGRTVFAEGGIKPDSIVNSFETNELLDQLINQDLYYRFVENYIYEHPGLTSIDVNEQIISDFYSFLNTQSFEYTSVAETKLTDIKALTSNKNYSDKIKNYITSLEDELKTERLRDFDRSKPVIKKQIEREILRKLNKTENEIIIAGLNDDNQVLVAIEIIRNMDLYNRILNNK